MDAKTLAKAMGNVCSYSRYVQLTPHVNLFLIRIGANTPARAAMALAQVCVESMGLRYFEEIASGSAYEGRRDLGNTQAGDGRRFKGHGPIQVTGRANHAACGAWAYKQGYINDPNMFVKNPALLATDAYGFLGAEWFFVVHNLNGFADRRDVRGATRTINGGYNGLAARTAAYARCSAMGSAILPGPVQVLADPTRCAKLQKTFNDMWLKPNKWTILAEDGIPGPATDRVIKAFQKWKGLEQDGIPGPATLSAVLSTWKVTI